MAGAMSFEGVPCPACGGGLRPWRRVPSCEPAITGTFALWRCAACGTAVTVEEESIGADLHEHGDYGGGAPRLSGLALPLLRAFDRRRLALVRQALAAGGHRGPIRLLDVGAGRGRFVDTARRAGVRAEGLEPTRRGVAAAAQRFGVALARCTVEDAALPAGSLDAITLWHVLEHLEHPGATLATLGQALRPGGVLLVGVPNLASWQARMGGERWFHLDVPRHRTHFTPTGLDALVRRSGLTPVGTHHLLAEHNPFGMWQTGASTLGPSPSSYLFHVLKRNAPLRASGVVPTLLALPFAPLAVLVELLAGWRRAGGTIALVAIRAPSQTADSM